MTRKADAAERMADGSCGGGIWMRSLRSSELRLLSRPSLNLRENDDLSTFSSRTESVNVGPKSKGQGVVAVSVRIYPPRFKHQLANPLFSGRMTKTNSKYQDGRSVRHVADYPQVSEAEHSLGQDG
jgi:hypothetical protein